MNRLFKLLAGTTTLATLMIASSWAATAAPLGNLTPHSQPVGPLVLVQDEEEMPTKKPRKKKQASEGKVQADDSDPDAKPRKKKASEDRAQPQDSEADAKPRKKKQAFEGKSQAQDADAKPRKKKASEDRAQPQDSDADPKARKKASEGRSQSLDAGAKPRKKKEASEGRPQTPDSDADAKARKKAGEDRSQSQDADAKPRKTKQTSQGRSQAQDAYAKPGKRRITEGKPQALETDADTRARKRQASDGSRPVDDRSAQAGRVKDIKAINAEKGKRRDRTSNNSDEPRRRQRPQGSEVLSEIGNRTIIQFNNQTIVEGSDRPRMARGARDVFVEDLPRGRTRETIVRQDGTQVITVRNSYGDVIRRSRITSDDHEYVLVYVDDDDYDRVEDWRDPGLDLPPMVLDVPLDEYILDARAADEPEVYYDFLQQPPVERIERLYSLDEVKRSARIRDKTRRIDIDTLTFQFGSANIDEDQIVKLESVARAMEKILSVNPAETFLIEGHTDAVGSDFANLALSDQRAEAVADALGSVFAIPAENLATQGYGEEYLKIPTEAPEQENRRVAIRRITPLVSPVASVN